MKLTKNSFILLLPMFFVFSASLLGTAPFESEKGITRIYMLPKIINSSAYVIYLMLVSFFSFLGLVELCKNRKVYAPILILVFSYFILVFWALVTSSDHIRYLTIFFSILLCPIGLLYIIERIDFKVFEKTVFFILSFFVFLSVIYSFLNYSTHPRVSGIHNNPNLMGMWFVSFLAVVLYLESYLNRNMVFLIVGVVTVLVLLSGSRLAFGMLFILLIPFILKFKFFSLLALVFLTTYLFLGGVDMEFRAVDIGSSVTDSGRSIIWSRALECINSEPLVGHGMLGAEKCVKIGNVHNSYLRVAVMLGIPLAILFFSLFFYFIAKVFMTGVSPFIKFYFLGLPAAFFAEDYIVGFASPFFPFFIFMLALFLFDLKRSKARLKELKV